MPTITINKQEFAAEVLLPQARDPDFPEGFGLGLKPCSNDFNFDKWLDFNRQSILDLVSERGCVTVKPANVPYYSNYINAGRVPHKLVNSYDLPWHCDGQDGIQLIMLAHICNSEARTVSTQVISTRALFSALKLGLPQSFTDDLRGASFILEEMYKLFVDSTPEEKQKLLNFWGQINQSLSSYIYSHRWTVNPNSVLLIDNQVSASTEYCKVSHARFTYGQPVHGAKLSRGSILIR